MSKPSFASVRAIALPMPRLEPVTRAIFSLVVAEMYDLDKDQASSTIILSTIFFLGTSLLIFLLPKM